MSSQTTLSATEYNSLKHKFQITNYNWNDTYLFIKCLKSGESVKYHKINNSMVITFSCLSRGTNLFILKLHIYIFLNSLIDYNDKNEKHIKKLDEYIKNDTSKSQYVPFELMIIENNKTLSVLDNFKNIIPIAACKNTETYLVSLPPYKNLQLKLSDIINTLITPLTPLTPSTPSAQ